MPTAASRIAPPSRGWNPLGLDLRPGEGATAWLLFFGFFLIVACQYVTKTVRQSTYVDSLGALNLPWVYLLVALCSYPLLRLYLRYADRVARHRLIAATCFIVAATMVLFWWLFRYPWPWVPVVFYVWVTITFGATVSQFWSFASHVFDARQARRLFGLVAAGGLLGGIAGGQMARLASDLAGPRSALLVAAVILIGVVLVSGVVRRRGGGGEASSGGVGATPRSVAGATEGPEAIRGVVSLLRRSRHLQLVSVLLVLSVVVAQIIDLQFNWAVERSTAGLGERTAFFGNFFSVAGVAALVFQIMFTARIHRRLGVGFALRALPVMLGLGTAGLLLVSGMLPELLVITALALKMSDFGLRHSLEASTRELLFVPLPPGMRLRARALLDVFIQRSARGLAALLLLPVTFGLLTPVGAGWLTLALVAVWLALAAATYRAYVRSIRTSLREGSVDSAVPINLNDVKTVELLVQSLGSTDPRQVLHSLELLEANGRANLVPPLLLYHDDAEVRRRTLKILAVAGRRDAAPLVERKLGDTSADVRAEAVRALTELNAADACDLMLPRLQESDPRVRAAAVTCLFNDGDTATICAARAALYDMLFDASPEQRAEAVKAIGAIRGSEFEGRLLQTLYDRDARVGREAIGAVRRLVSREGFSPLYAPRLVSLLANRRLKHDAREALVAFGEDAIPILVHFMNEPEEAIWVRRALPKTLARIPGPKTLEALLEALHNTGDAPLRAQIVEALALRRDEVASSGAAPRIAAAIAAEARRCLTRLTDLAALGSDRAALRGSPAFRFEGPIVQTDHRELNLLTQMIAERIEERLATMFGLLALLHPPHDIWAAYRSLLSGRRALRVHALEYLDNTLSGEVRRNVFAVIDDSPVEEKLRLATRQFGIPAVSRSESVGRFLGDDGAGDAEGAALAVAGLYTVYTERMQELYPRIVQMFRQTRDPLVRETAQWVAGQLHLPLTSEAPS